jgi:ADP-ribose pyrophosphatase YjhB (NUDIX family)
MRLIQGNKWLVPGGYVFQDESVDEAAKRNLYQQTQLDHLVLHQFASFGASGRQMGVDNSDIEQINMPKDIVDWITNRFVTIAYYSIIADPKTKIIIGELYDSAKWLNIDEVDGLAMDHSTIVMEARKALAKDLLSRPILLSFLPADFIMPDLQKLYEAIIGRTVDRGNFRKRMLKSGFLIKTGQVVDNAPQRPPELYILDKERYLNSLSEDVKLGF